MRQFLIFVFLSFFLLACNAQSEERVEQERKRRVLKSKKDSINREIQSKIKSKDQKVKVKDVRVISVDGDTVHITGQDQTIFYIEIE